MPPSRLVGRSCQLPDRLSSRSRASPVHVDIPGKRAMRTGVAIDTRRLAAFGRVWRKSPRAAPPPSRPPGAPSTMPLKPGFAPLPFSIPQPTQGPTGVASPGARRCIRFCRRPPPRTTAPPDGWRRLDAGIEFLPGRGEDEHPTLSGASHDQCCSSRRQPPQGIVQP